MKIYNHTFRGIKTLHFLDRKGFVLSFECNSLRGQNRAGWFLSDEVECESLILQPSLKIANQDLRRWIFDPSWYDQIEAYDPDEGTSNGTIAVFKILNETTSMYQEKYLHIYNRQDGGYSRHFDFSDKQDELLEVGDL